MTTINPDNLKDKVSKAILKSLEAQQASIFLGMNNLRADMLERIFDAGKSSDERTIGKYSTKPIYVPVQGTSQVRSSSLRPSGKNSKEAKFKNGNPRKSAYMAGGYSEYRKTVGRQNSKVDLRLTGSLQLAIVLGQRNNGIVLAFNNDDQLRKAAGNEKRFGKIIFDPSENEIQALVDLWEKETTEAFFNSIDE